MKEINHYFDRFIELLKFIWEHRYGNKNIVAYRLYLGAVGFLLAGYGVAAYIDSTGKWVAYLSIGEIGKWEAIIISILTFAFFVLLYFLNRKDFNTYYANELAKIARNQFLQSIIPLKPFEDFCAFYNKHQVAAYIETAELSKKKAKLLDYNTGHIRILGLSGMGKTFFVLESFKSLVSTDNIYYCDSICHHAFHSSLETLYTHTESCTVILDNCPNNTFTKAINDFGTKIRFISIYYDPSDYQSAAPYGILKIEDDTNIITRIIEENAEKDIPENDKKLLVHHSGKIPFMALLLTQAYNKTSQIGHIDNSVLISNLLDIKGSNPEEQRIAMRTLSLCQPLDYNNGTSDIAKYLINSKWKSPARVTPEAQCR